MSCQTPYVVKHKTKPNESIPVPCGKCPACLKRRASGWSFRLMQQDKVSESSHFITLTYDTSYVPISRNGFMELNKRHLQLFFKRLRKAHQSLSLSNSRIKYYAVGEYGGRTNRPHYHIIMFNCAVELIQPAWNMGSVHYGTVTEDSVGYTLKYMCKPKRIPMHRNDDRQPEFGLMSKGLGLSYITPEMYFWHHADKFNRMYCVTKDGFKIAMPRYYKNWLYDEHERKGIGVVTRQEMLKREYRLAALGMLPTEREKAASIEYQFRNMHKTATNGRDKI